MSTQMDAIRQACVAGASSDDVDGLPLPRTMRAVTTHKDEVEMFAGVASRDKDPTRSLHLDEVPLPRLGPNEALVAVMA